jgi:hypothetical protein
MQIFGVDFTSAPSARKPIAVARGTLEGRVLSVHAVEALTHLEAFEALLREPGPWLGGFDLPFGLPRELVLQLRWPTDWPSLIQHYGAQSRQQLRDTFRQFCDARPTGGKFAHRRTDGPAGSSPSMKWVNPPVAWMLHAGAPRLLASGVCLPGLHPGDAGRIALEAYPGFAARSVTRESYKSDDPRKHTDERRRVRAALVRALERGEVPALSCDRLPVLQVQLPEDVRQAMIDEGSADRLDAVFCAAQAAHAFALPRHGLPENVDPVEGWIAGVPPRE